MAQVLELIAARRFSYAPLITHRFGLDEVDDAFRALHAAGPDFVKAVIVP
jgi:threonine dehydrogenase-like Zn-dependent dehydrogenase